MRLRGGKKMQAISEKYNVSMMHKNTKASDRFIVRMDIARQVNQNVTNLSSELYKNLIQNLLNGTYEERKK